LLQKELDLGQVTKRWQETFAEPAMQAWWEYNAPNIREEFAGVPGAFYSADRARGVAREASRYMSTAITPTLYQSLETAAARRPGIIGAMQALGPVQTELGLTDLSRAVTSAGINPYLMAMLGHSPLQVNAAGLQTGGSGIGSALGGLAGMALGALGGPIGAAAQAMTGMESGGAAGGLLGSIIGGLF